MDEVGEPSLVSSLRLRRGEVAGASAAGARLATGGGDGALRLWAWGSGRAWEQRAEVLRAHRYGVTAVRFAPSGLLLATAGVDGAARVWAGAERGTLAALGTLAAPHAAAARALAWAGGERAVVGHDDGAVRVWAPRSGALLALVRAHEGAVHAVATLASAALLLTACTDGVLKVFEFDEIISHGREGVTGPSPILWEDGAHDLGALCAAGSARDAATGGHDGRVRLWRVEGAGGARRVSAGGALLGHSAAVTALSWRRGVLASASLDRTARLWCAASATCLRVLHAHERYLTCVELAHDLRYMITASNDKSIRTWSLGYFCVSDDIEPTCNPLVHFGLGDLEGIGPVSETESDIENLEGLLCTSTDTRRLAHVSHVAAINSIAISKEHIATACSDGYVRVFKWLRQEEIVLELELELAAHSYPVLSVDFGADGALLLSGGLDGCARLWDVHSGCELVVFSAESINACGGEGGGGVRDTRLSIHRPPLLLIACDDGHAALWGINPPSPDPLHVYTGLAEAALCCAWSADGRVFVMGGEAGELHLLLPPSCPGTLHQETDAHDLGVLSCDFAPNFEVEDSEKNTKTYLLATGGRDALVKLWWVELEGVTDTSVDGGSLRLAKSLPAHGGAVQCVRWGAAGEGEGAAEGELWLATGGADRWARVWRVRSDGGALSARAFAALPAAAGGAPAVRLLPAHARALAVGALSGELALWSLPAAHLPHEEEGADVRAWGSAGVARWLREYVTRPPGSSAPDLEESRLLEAIQETALTGPQLLDKSIEDLMTIFGYGENESESSLEEERGEVRARLLDELLWLRRDELSSELERGAPHALRCPLTHAALREPARAADGFTYERRNILHWMLAAGAGGEELRSPMTGLRLSSARVEPNYGVRAQLRRYCGWRHEAAL